MRFKHQGVWTDGNGRRIDSAVVSAFLAGTDTAASVYADSSGGVAINSVTTDESGLYEFWVDDTDYTQGQLFKIIMAKANFQSKTIDDIIVFPKNRMILDGEQNFYIDGRTSPRLITLGAERQEHTAGIAGTRAKHIDVKPAGFDDTSGIVIVQDLDSSSTDIRVKGLNFNADVSGATNAHVNAIEVSKVGDLGSGMRIDALDVRPGIGVIDHHSGAVASVDTAFKYDDSGTSYTDVATEFGSTGSDISIFDENKDYIYIGDASQFNTIEVILATVASKSVKPIFEYSQGSGTWNTLPVSDDTNGFRENGNIFYHSPGDWATDTVNAVASKYWIRIQRNNNNVPIVPIEDTIKIIASTDYTWDAAGNLVVNNVTAANLVYTDSPQDIGGPKNFTDNPTVTNISPRYLLSETGVTADNGKWDLLATNEILLLRVLSDDAQTAANIFAASRIGTTADIFNILSTDLQHNGVKVPTISSTDTQANKTFTSPIINSPSSSGEVYSGTYTPTKTNIANVTVSSGGSGTYIRTGDVCTVCVNDIVASATVGGTLTRFTLSLPIASSFGGTSQGAGVGAADSGSAIVVAKVEPYISTDTLLVDYYPTSTTPNTLAITFTYRII